MLTIKKIALLVIILSISIFLILDYSIGHSGFMLTHYNNVASAFYFLQTEDEYKNAIRNTEQATWFEKTFPDTQPKYIIGYGYRQLQYKYDTPSGFAYLEFLEAPPDFSEIKYLCINGEIHVNLVNPTSSYLEDEGNCFMTS